MATDQKKIKAMAKKLLENEGSTPLSQLEILMDLHESIGELIKAVKDIPKTEIPEGKETDLSETNSLLKDLITEMQKPCEINLILE